MASGTRGSGTWSIDDVVTVMSGLHEGVVVVDRAAMVRFASAAAGDAFGVTSAQPGQALWDVVPGLRGSSVGEQIAAAAADLTDTAVEGYVGTVGRWLRIRTVRHDDLLVLLVRDATADVRLLRREELTRRLGDLEPGVTFDDDLRSLLAAIRRTIGYPAAEAWLSTSPDESLRIVVDDLDDRPDLRSFHERSVDLRMRPAVAHGALAGPDGLAVVPDVWSIETFVANHAGHDLRLRSLFRLNVGPGHGLHLVLVFLSDGPNDHDMWPVVLRDAMPMIRTWIAGRWADHELERYVSVSQELLCLLDADLVVRRANPRLMQVLGYGEDELAGRRIDELVHPDDVAGIVEVCRGLLQRDARAHAVQARLIAADGAVVRTTWDLRGNPHDATIAGAGRDITEEHRAARMREHRNEVLASIAAAAPIVDTLRILSSAIAEQCHGAVAEIRVFDPERRHGGRGPDAEGGVVRRITGAGGEQLGAITIHRDDSAPLSAVEEHLVDDAVRLAGIAIDRDRTARRLTENEERLRLLARVTTDVIFDWDLVERVVWFSEPDSVEVDDAPVRWPIDAVMRGRVHPDDRTRLAGVVKDAIRVADGLVDAEFRFRRADGTYAEVVARGVITRDASGRARRLVGGISDVSEQRQLERQFLRAQRMESIGALAGGIAHDLNNTLAPVLMAVDLMRGEPLGDDARGALDMIDLSARRGAAMVRQVLTFASGAPGERGRVDVAGVVDDVARIVRDSFPKGIELVIDVERELPSVSGDPTQLHQVLLNLAVNARDAMDGSGTLTLRAWSSTVAARRTTGRGEHDLFPGRHVVIEVGDTGSGIPPEHRVSIFDPFFTTKPATVGTGLGLPTSLAIVRSHDGTITVDSEPGRGSAFRVHLPVDVDVAATTRPPARERPARGRGEVVLLVDDEAAIRAVTSQLLHFAGYQVLTATDGLDALHVVDGAERIDLVLTDLMMPTLDGAGLVRALRERGNDVPVVVASGLADSVDGARLDGAGVHSVLQKPFDADTLLAVLDAALAH